MSEVILLLDDDPAALAFLNTVLSEAGFTCVGLSEPAQALVQVGTRQDIAVIVSDIRMPRLSGLQFVQQVNSLNLAWPAPAVLLLTGHPTVELAVGAFRLGACDFLTKPIRPRELIDVVNRTLQRVRAQRRAPEARPADVHALIIQAEEVVGALRRRINLPAESPYIPPQAVPAPAPPPGATTVEAHWPKGRIGVLDAIDGLRKLRRNYDDHKLDDVAWDLLLEILRAHQGQQRLSVTALTISVANVSSTTSLRRVSELTARGYIERVPDASDGRRDFVRLTGKALALLSDYLEHADSCLIDLQSDPRTARATPRR
jgi:FixJ family two-component response regulator/DNA-binding MarR family transcriptional regulator